MIPGRSMSALIFRIAEKRIPRAEAENRGSTDVDWDVLMDLGVYPSEGPPPRSACVIAG
jgi:hypothetical protein